MKALIFLFLIYSSICSAQDWQRNEVYQGQRSNTAIAANFDQQGKDEIVYFAEKTIFLVSADGKKRRQLKTQVNTIHSAVADIDGDGDLDYIGAFIGLYWLECPENIWQDEWKYHLISDKLIFSHAVEVYDINQDGRVDVIANSFKNEGEYPDSICWFENPISGDEWKAFPLAHKNAQGGSHYFKIFKENGSLKLCAGAKGKPFIKGNYYALYSAAKDVSLPWTKSFLLEDQEGATNIVPADFNEDGIMDYAIANGHGLGVKLIDGKSKKLIDIDLEMACPHTLAVADIDGDGDMDIATCGYESAELAWYENTGKQSFKKHSISKSQKAYDIRIKDIDGDGVMDILVAGQMSNNVVWYKQIKK